MTYQDFYRLRLDALDCTSADQLIAEEGGSVDCDDLDKLIREFTAIYECRDIKSIRALTGLSQKAFGAEYHIPRRTVEDWERTKTPPQYVVDMLLYAVLSDLE